MDIKDGVLDLTPTAKAVIKEKTPNPGAETVAYLLGIIPLEACENPFHGKKARPGQYIMRDGLGGQRDMCEEINAHLHGFPKKQIVKDKYKRTTDA